jgi:Na+/H+-dicarboxylate symporter
VSAHAPQRRRKLGLATQVLIGLGLGVGVGIFFGEGVAFLKLGGDAFIALLQITVIPYVMVALITSVGRLSLSDAKALSVRAGSILLLLWALGVAIVLLAPLAFPNWPSASFFSASTIEGAKPVDFLKLYIPANVFSDLADAVVPAIVVFSILFGLALINVAHKERTSATSVASRCTSSCTSSSRSS